MIHSLQACIPQAIILPTGVDRLVPGVGYGGTPCRVSARERSDQGDLLVFDVEVIDDRGRTCERLGRAAPPGRRAA